MSEGSRFFLPRSIQQIYSESDFRFFMENLHLQLGMNPKKAKEHERKIDGLDSPWASRETFRD
tara:strand:- start:15160 stop:15348 length:189 start_codon:yes stop_codon:yes gene_type:complete